MGTPETDLTPPGLTLRAMLTIDDDEHRERMESVGYPCDCRRCIGPDGQRIPSRYAQTQALKR
jgi:hypothetical protein